MILGIDPGQKGALAFYKPSEDFLDIVDMPVAVVQRNGKTKAEVSPAWVNDAISAHKIERAVIEQVGAMPGQGVSSMFQFGCSFGIVLGVLAARLIPVTKITPQAWRKRAAVREGKDGSRQRAAELFPLHSHLFARVKDDGRADAAIMAFLGAHEVAQ